MPAILRNPYPFEASFRRRTIVSLGISVFVFLFLYIFQPFGLNTYPLSVFYLTLGYGLVSMLVLTLFNIIILYTFPSYFSEENWNTGRELFWFIVLLFFIGLGNSLYTWLAGIGNLNWKTLLVYEFYTVAVGIFPITLSVLINQARLKSNFEHSSEELTQLLKHPEISTPYKTETSEPHLSITLIAENGKDAYTFSVEDILFIKSAENYAEVFFYRDARTNCELIRTSLLKCETALKDFPDYFRCHKSYIVNLKKVRKVSGNAQGYKLHLEFTDDLIPVSRSKNDLIKELFATRP